MAEDKKKLNIQLDFENTEELKAVLVGLGNVKLISKVVNALLKTIPKEKKLSLVKSMTIEERMKLALKNPELKKEIEQILLKTKN